MTDHISNLSDASFQDDVLDSDIPVLVDFWAPWCAPCRMIAPILEELAPQYAGKVKFAKMNVDDNTKTPSKYGVRGIPTLLIFKHGELQGTHVGALSKPQLSQFVDANC